MKTSLIAKTKQIDRKNSEALEDSKSSLINSKHIQPEDKLLKSPKKSDEMQFKLKK